MITVNINGEDQAVGSEKTIADLLRDLNINCRYCAVERNLQLIPREQHNDCWLVEGDRVEIVTLVGGG